MNDRPIITLTTDFGLADTYVAQMKGALLRECPMCLPVDVTHEIPRHDLIAGALALERAVSAFGASATHLAVIDPGVGTSRRLLVAELGSQRIVCPDNGLITWALRRAAPLRVRCHELQWRPDTFSATFHGRDIMAPVAGMLAAGRDIDQLATPIDDPVLLPMALATAPLRGGVVLHIDHFGNATTNVPAALIDRQHVIVQQRDLGPVRHTYADAPLGQPLALIGSSGLLEIAVCQGSAARILNLHVGDELTVK